MTQSYEFLIARADEAATEAEQALLDNVRQRARRAEAAWREMADRALKTDRARDCQDFRVWAGIMGEKESQYVPTQGAGDPG